ncbi:hypothetical protein PspLS_11536 [Pyricularia sp. CBS 133598]|nr:hypothetical protein PspLS_11536 [Pyricularia sp. CBS 133598]
MDPDTEPPTSIPVNDNHTKPETIPNTKDRMRGQWDKCHQVQTILSQIEIRDVVSALGINELQAAELQGCIFTLLATGPTSLCFAAERMVIRLSKERWPDLLCWNEIPSIWLTEAMQECVEHVKRGGDLAKEVRDLKEQSDGEQVTEKAAQPVSASQYVADRQEEDVDLQKSIEISSATMSGDDQADDDMILLSKVSKQTAEVRDDNSRDNFEPMLGLEDTSKSSQAVQLQRDEPTSVVIATPTKQIIDEGPLVSSARTMSGRDSHHQISPLQSSSPGLFVTPEREHRRNGPAAEVYMQGRSLDVDMPDSDGIDGGLDELSLKKDARQSPEGKQAKVVLDCKFDRGLNRQMYLVRWTGYPETDDSWELIEHTTEYIGLVVEYNKQQSSKQRYDLGHGVADASTTHTPTANQTPSPKTKSKIIPANHVLLRMLGQSKHGAIERNRPETTTGAFGGAISSSQASGPPPGDGREPKGDASLPDAEDLSVQPEEGVPATGTADVEGIEAMIPTPSSTYSQSRLLPTSSPLTSRKTALSPAVIETSSTKTNDHGRSASPTPSDAPLYKPKASAFPMVGPGWKKLGKSNLSRSQSPSPSPALADPRAPTSSSGDIEDHDDGRRNEAYVETSQPVRPASKDRVFRGSSDRNPHDKADSGPFRHIKFVKPAKKAAPGHDKVQLGERSSHKQPSILGASSTSSPVTANRTACQPGTLKTKPSTVMRLEDHRADELPDKPQRASSTTVHKMVKPVPTLHKPQQTPRRKLVNLKTGEVTYLDQTRKPDAQPNRASSATSTAPLAGTRVHAGLDRRAAMNPPAQSPSTQGMSQAGAKRKRSGDDLPADTHAAKRTNLFGP